MRQLRVVAVTSPEYVVRLEELLDCEQLSRMATLRPQEEELDRAVSLPAEAVILYTSSLTAAEADFLNQLYLKRSDLALLIICQNADADTYARAMSCGVTRVLNADLSSEELAAAAVAEVARLNDRRGGTAPEFDSRVISLFGTKGGCGKTSLAVNIAVALTKAGKKTAIVDLDLQFGDVGVCLNLPRCETISDLAGESKLTAAAVGGYLCRHSTGLKVLCAPTSPELAELVKPAMIERLATVLRAEYDYVIFDLGTGLDDCTITALEQSDAIYFVTNPEIPTLKNTRICLGVLETLGLGQKLRLILNRAGNGDVTEKDVVTALDRKPVLTVPVDFKTAVSAINRGVPAVLASPRAAMSKAIIKFIETGKV